MFEYSILNETNRNRNTYYLNEIENDLTTKITSEASLHQESKTPKFITSHLVKSEEVEEEKSSFYENVHNNLVASIELEEATEFEVFTQTLPENSFIETAANTMHSSSMSSNSSETSSSHQNDYISINSRHNSSRYNC